MEPFSTDREDSDKRLKTLSDALSEHRDLCSSEGVLDTFPQSLLTPYYTDYVGLIVCVRGEFGFSVNKKPFVAHEGETAFISEGSQLSIDYVSDDVRYMLLFYKVEPIRDILGNTVVTMRLYSMIDPSHCSVWTTGDEADIACYISLLTGHHRIQEDTFASNEHKLLLIALTYRLCSLFSNRLVQNSNAYGRKFETLVNLVELISKYYTHHRSVVFYADKLCLSPKYLSSMVKSVCGYTVQELVFRAIVRRAIFLMKNTNNTIQEISDSLSFPNPSAFGTFFKKQTGLSPKHYRNAEQ